MTEQVKTETREIGTAPTRFRVLDLAQERKKMERRELEQIDKDYAHLKVFRWAVDFATL